MAAIQSTTNAGAKAINCPSCGGSIAIKAAGYTVTLVCQYCSSVLDVANPDVRLITAYQSAAADLELPLGTRGTIKGVEWEVIGYIQRSDEWVRWNEYLLFNPYAGYRWLIDSGRGWSFGTMLTATPTQSGDKLVYDGETYDLFFRPGDAKVDYVLGEFYWRVKAGDTVVASDYARPGKMLSLEYSDQETTWTLNEWLPPGTIHDIFGIREDPQWPHSGLPPLPHQLSPYTGKIRPLAKIGAVAFGFILLLTTTFGCTGTGAKQTLHLPLERPAQTVALGTITVDRPYQPVTITATAPSLDNRWVDLEYSLVNRATQQSIDAYGAAEYYHGTDSDGSWSEGDKSVTTKIASVPRGTYDLMVDAEGHDWGKSVNYFSPDGTSGQGSASQATPDIVDVQVEFAKGGMFLSNLLLAFLLLFAPIIWLAWQAMKFNQARDAEKD